MVLSREDFDDMIKSLDKDGDGTVERAEFYGEYYKLQQARGEDIGPEDGPVFNEIWNTIDANGDGDLSVKELAAFYGFNLDADVTTEMTDEAILEALALQAQLDILNAAATAKKKNLEPPKKMNDKTIKVINLECGHQLKPEDEEQHAFMCCCQMGDFTQNINKEEHAKMFLEEDRKAGPIDPRVQDERGEMPLHKMARFVTEKYTGIPSGGGGELAVLFHRLIEIMKADAKAKGRPGIHSDINHQSKDGKTPLFLAVEFKNEKMIDLLYSLGVNGPDSLLVNSVGWTVMHAAVNTDHMPTLQRLVEKFTTGRIKVLLTTPDKTGREALHIAAYKCTPEMNGFLVDLGATDKKSDAAGKVPSELAQQVFQNTGDQKRRASKEIIDAKIKIREGRNSKDDIDGNPRQRKSSKEYD